MSLLTAYRRWWLQLCIGYYRAAQASVQLMNPCHEDIPFFVITTRNLSDQLEQLKGAA